MEWDPNQRDAWVSDAQRWVCQLQDVLQCKIDLDDEGEVASIHVVAGMDRDPRHIVRDVEGILKTRLDMDVYYKKIGVVQVLDNTPRGESKSQAPAEERPVAKPQDRGRNQAVNGDGTSESPLPQSPGTEQPGLNDPVPAILVVEDPTSRVVCGGVSVMASDAVIRAEVQLRAGEVESRGLREGPNHADSDLSLIAQAAVAAVAELIADPVLLHLQEVRLQSIGAHTVVMAAVDLVEGRQSTTLFGTCNISHNRQQAVVYAVLDAMNRRLSMHGLKTLKGSG